MDTFPLPRDRTNQWRVTKPEKAKKVETLVNYPRPFADTLGLRSLSRKETTMRWEWTMFWLRATANAVYIFNKSYSRVRSYFSGMTRANNVQEQQDVGASTKPCRIECCTAQHGVNATGRFHDETYACGGTQRQPTRGQQSKIWGQGFILLQSSLHRCSQPHTALAYGPTIACESRHTRKRELCAGRRRQLSPLSKAASWYSIRPRASITAKLSMEQLR